ncbi:hypothetical protein J3E69DRAFT_343537 [Trichoderma sp. SZMC 28015]
MLLVSCDAEISGSAAEMAKRENASFGPNQYRQAQYSGRFVLEDAICGRVGGLPAGCSQPKPARRQQSTCLWPHLAL